VLMLLVLVDRARTTLPPILLRLPDTVRRARRDMVFFDIIRCGLDVILTLLLLLLITDEVDDEDCLVVVVVDDLVFCSSNLLTHSLLIPISSY